MARDGDEVVKAMLSPRFQEAIDEAAMRLGDTDAEAYLAGWTRDPWTAADGTPAEAAGRQAAALEEDWPEDRLTAYLDELHGASSGPDPISP